jgi:uncharacterized membrane protein (UPF0182 family)
VRTPADFPRRRRAERVSGRGRAWLVVLAVALFLLLTSLRGIAGFYTDYLWFDSLNYDSVFTGILSAKFALGAIFTGIFFGLLWLNLLIADRLAPRFRPAGPEEEVIERYRELIGNRTGLVRAAVSGLFALIAGAGVSAQWNNWLLFTNAQTMGTKDPQFNVDIGFYLFRLPFLSFVIDWAFASIVIVLIVVAVAHYLNGGIRVSGTGQRVTPQVKAHLSVLLGLLALLRAAGYWLARFELNFSDRGAVRGAAYTDVNAQLPALELLAVISLAAFVLLIVNIWRRGWVLPVLAVGLWAFTALVVGGIYPAFVQRFTVEPAESTRERPYIERNITATRAALGLDVVEEEDFAASNDLLAEDLVANASTIRNVRLLDPAVVNDTYQRLQGIRAFYRFPDLDVDRYTLDGETTQVVLAARELDRSNVPQQSWEARTLAYTHGYGAAVSPANATTTQGRPNFVVGGLPPTAPPELALDQPSIYFGEDIGGYSIVKTDREEVNFVAGDGSTDQTTYDGEGGVVIGGLFRRVAFALRFGDFNPVVSNFVRSDSRILYIRDVQERVNAIAPFLDFDADPYPVIIDGRIVYVIDGYTTSNHYPYAETATTGDLEEGSGLDHSFNYVRNSVKVVVDAYDGDATFYISDPTDVLIQAYQQAFPDLFTPIEEMPSELRDHLRYPEDLFRTQTTMWGRYHIDNPDDFYSQSDGWNVAQDPGSVIGETAQGTATTNPATGELGNTRDRRIDPYYQLMRLPGDEDESFVMLRPFTPFSEDDERNELTAFMVASSDPEDYGRLRTFTMPRNNLPDGPAIVAANISAEESVSSRISLLNREGSEVRLGNLLLIPVEQSLLYVRPLYTQASGETAVPELKNVIVVYGDDVVMRPTLQQALEVLFGAAPETQEETLPDDGVTDGQTGGDTGATPPDVSSDVAELLAQAGALFEDANAALAAGDLGAYQDLIDEIEGLVSQAEALTEADATGATPTTTPTPTTSTTEPPTA